MIKDPLFLSITLAWITIYLIIPITGYYIEFHEDFYSASGAAFDAAFTKFHQDFAFFLLPALVTTVPGLRDFWNSGKGKDCNMIPLSLGRNDNLGLRGNIRDDNTQPL